VLAHLRRVQGRQPDRLGAALTYIGPGVFAMLARRARRILASTRRRPTRWMTSRARSPANSALTAAEHDQRDRPNKGGAGALLGIDRRRRWSAWVHRRVHAGLQRDLRGAGGPAVLEAAPAAGRRHASRWSSSSRWCSWRLS
jgi:hypothetical protein